MQKIISIKLVSILLLVGILFYIIFFELFDFEKIIFFDQYKTSIENFINKNYLLFIFIFFLFVIIWTIFIGFGTPITFFSGFFLGNIIGTIIVLISFTIGSTILYSVASLYFRSKIKNSKILNKYEYIIEKIKKNEFDYFFLFRIVGGLKMPLIIQNLLPITIDMKIKNFFWATILGMGPSTFINVSIGKVFYELWNTESEINIFEIFYKNEIYIPFIGLIVLTILSYFIKKKYFIRNNKN